MRFPKLALPAAASELEITAEMQSLPQRNFGVDPSRSFLGAGAYHHFRPAVVDYVLRRGEFYTSYTQYQPETSQGMLQALFEYQSMICRLTGMEVSNASHYDGATALAEAVLLALNVAQGQTRQDHHVAGRSSRSTARWYGPICAAPMRPRSPATKITPRNSMTCVGCSTATPRHW